MKLEPKVWWKMNAIVFIHRSIKTRIETGKIVMMALLLRRFLYIDPLKQGLKQEEAKPEPAKKVMFLYIDPLKQGLKHLDYESACKNLHGFYT